MLNFSYLIKYTTRNRSSFNLSAREKIEKSQIILLLPLDYLLNTLYKEVLREGVDSDTFKLQYRKSLYRTSRNLVKEDRLD